MSGSSAGSRLRAAVIGVGHMGRIHARTYAKMPEWELVGVVDRDLPRAQAVAAEVGTAAFATLEEIADRVDAVTVAVPTSVHVAVAELCLSRRIPMLVEKPLAATAEQAERLAARAAAVGCLLQVGHSERFNPAFNAIEGMGLTPKYIECRRLSPFTFRAIDVGVVMDLMIHDIDIALHLAGGEPIAVEALGVNVVGPHEDMADVRIGFDNGCSARLSASRLASSPERGMQVFTDDACVSVDYLNKRVRIARRSGRLTAAQSGGDGAPRLTDIPAAELIVREEIVPTDHEPVLMELREFAECVRGRRRPRAGGTQGARAVRVAERILESIRRHAWDGRPDGRIGLFTAGARGGGR